MPEYRHRTDHWMCGNHVIVDELDCHGHIKAVEEIQFIDDEGPNTEIRVVVETLEHGIEVNVSSDMVVLAP